MLNSVAPLIKNRSLEFPQQSRIETISLYLIRLFLLLPVSSGSNQIRSSSMEGLGGVSGDDGASAPPEVLVKWRRYLAIRFQYYLDRSVPHTKRRWLGTLMVAIIYILRVYSLKGFYVVSYGLATYLLNMLIGFVSPKVDPEFEGLDGVSFPTKDSDESKPRFVRRLPEFKFCFCGVVRPHLHLCVGCSCLLADFVKLLALSLVRHNEASNYTHAQTPL